MLHRAIERQHIVEINLCMRFSHSKLYRCICLNLLIGDTISRILSVLEILDRHNFDRVDQAMSTSIDPLYQKVFSTEKIKEANSEVSFIFLPFALSGDYLKNVRLMACSDKTYVGMEPGPGLIQCQSIGSA